MKKQRFIASLQIAGYTTADSLCKFHLDTDLNLFFICFEIDNCLFYEYEM